MRGSLSLLAPVLAVFCQFGAATSSCTVPDSPLYHLLQALPPLVEHTGCKNALLDYADGLANCSIGSLQMYDSSTKYPDGLLITNGYYLGHFDLCLGAKSPNFVGKYCVVDVHFRNNAESFSYNLNSRFKVNRDVARIALCIPSTCYAKDIEAAFQRLSDSNSLLPRGIFSQSGLQLKENQCTTLDPNESKHSTAKTVWMLVIALYLVTIMVTPFYEPQEDDDGSLLSIIQCFSLTRHWKRLLNPSPVVDSIDCINGMRVLALSMVILGHRSEAIASGPLLNPDFMEKIFENPFVNILLLNGSVIVDIFFTVSGLLTCKKALKSLELGEKPSYISIFWRRYFRLAPTYAMGIILQAYVIEDLGSGPLWGMKVGREAENCRKNWWANLLFINNYWDPQHICMDPSWHLACDMQLLVLGLLIIHATTHWQRLRLVPFITAFVTSFWIPFFVTYFHGLDPTVIPDPQTVGRTAQNSTNLLLYITGYCRTGPYLVGMAAAFIMQALKNNKTQQTKEFWKIGWYSAAACVFGSVIIGYPFFTTRQLHPFWASIYAGSFRTTFSVGVAFGIIACSCGKGGWLNEILSAPPFLILSRISYSAYLSHTLWLQLSYSWIRSPLYATDLFQVSLILSDLLISSVVGFAMHLLVEAPVTDLTNMFLYKPKNKMKH